MKVLDPGHFYELQQLDGELDSGPSYLIFVKREGERYPGNVGHYPGTIIQDVLRCLIDRLKYVDHQIPHQVNKWSIMYLRLIIKLLEHRVQKATVG